MRSRKVALLALALGPLALVKSFVPQANAAYTPEKETALLSRLLKPIPDQRWKEIAGGRISETYEIAKKDTLWDISQRLFGDSRYWPKIWALNNTGITNPHLIRPGKSIAFMPGTGSELPQVSVSDSPGTDAQASSFVQGTRGVGGSEEWKYLPPQRWEEVEVRMPLPTQVDPLGFDRRNRVTFSGPKGFEPEYISSGILMEGLGRIIGSRTSSRMLSMHDIVTVEEAGDLEAGSTYALTRAPAKLDGSKKDRTVYSYQILGRIKILAAEEGNLIGRIVSARDEIRRGDFLIRVPPRVPEMTPIAGPSALEATLLVDPRRSSSATAQHKTGFVDLGSEDGLRPGMVFRVHTYSDPVNRTEMEANDLTFRADLMITQANSTTSSGIFISSSEAINNGARAILLTDVSALIKIRGVREKELDGDNSRTKTDELDALDNGDSLTPGDEEELKQLEKHKEEGETPSSTESPNDSAPAPGPRDEPTPLEEMPAPEDMAPTAPLPEPPAPQPAPTQKSAPPPSPKFEDEELPPPPPPPDL